jgi:hypothetical protein
MSGQPDHDDEAEAELLLARLSPEDQALVRLAMAHGLTVAEAIEDLREAGGLEAGTTPAGFGGLGR